MLPGLRRATGEKYCDNLSSVSILREGGRTQEIGSLPHFVEVDSFIFYSQTQENFFNFLVKLNFEVEAATKNHLSIHFE